MRAFTKLATYLHKPANTVRFTLLLAILISSVLGPEVAAASNDLASVNAVQADVVLDASYYIVMGIGLAGLIWVRRLAQTL